MRFYTVAMSKTSSSSTATRHRNSSKMPALKPGDRYASPDEVRRAMDEIVKKPNVKKIVDELGKL